ncbi:hypothetical protein HDU98_005040, partial [Podochytrium sp. JEL0797]
EPPQNFLKIMALPRRNSPLRKHKTKKSQSAKSAKAKKPAKRRVSDCASLILSELLCGRNEWERGVCKFAETGHANNRSADSIKNMFRNKKMTKKPAGDPNQSTPERWCKNAAILMDNRKSTLQLCDDESWTLKKRRTMNHVIDKLSMHSLSKPDSLGHYLVQKSANDERRAMEGNHRFKLEMEERRAEREERRHMYDAGVEERRHVHKAELRERRLEREENRCHEQIQDEERAAKRHIEDEERAAQRKRDDEDRETRAQ